VRRGQIIPGGTPPPPLDLARGARVPSLPKSFKQASENGKDCRVRKRTTRARQEPEIQREKVLTAQRPCTYTHPTRPIKLLGPPHEYPQPAPTGQAPVVYAARCLHVPLGSNSRLDLT
jgi:hypothetical protein